MDAIADVEAIDWGLVPASHLGFPQLLEIAGLMRAALARPTVSGVVVVQGTDVMEETAFAFDLLVDSPKPVVVVGAMRTRGRPGLRRTRQPARRGAGGGGTRRSQGQGTVVVMDGDILPADDVVKTHTDALDTFQALEPGSAGARVRDGGVTMDRASAPSPAAAACTRAAAEPVPLITVTVAMDGALVRAATALGARGLVVAATGSGNTDPDILAAAVGGDGGRASRSCSPPAASRAGSSAGLRLPGWRRALDRGWRHPGGVAGWRPRRASRWRSGWAPGSTTPGWPPARLSERA